MFRKVVANLPFSPSLINQLGFYSKRLNKEKVTRKLGVIFTIFAILIQTITFIAPAKATLAANANDIVYGGNGKTKQGIIDAYVNNGDALGRRDIQAIFNSFGIDEQSLRGATYENIQSTVANDYWSIGRYPRGTGGEMEVAIPNGPTIYSRTLHGWSANTTWGALRVNTPSGVRWILLECGNIVTTGGYQPPREKVKSFTVNKKVTADLTGPIGDLLFWYAQKDITVQQGTKLRYLIQIGNNGEVPLQLNYADSPPPETPTRPGGDWIAANITLQPGETRYITIAATASTVGGPFKNVACAAVDVNNDGLNNDVTLPICSDAFVRVTPTPPPIYNCTSLTALKQSDNGTYDFTLKGTAGNGATISKYEVDYGDGNKGEGPTTKHTYTAPGSYTAIATITAKLPDGTTKTATAPACRVEITIPSPPGVPNYEITKLVRKSDADQWQKATATTYSSMASFQIAVRNTGETTLKNLKVTDTLPKGLTYIEKSLQLDDKPLEGNPFTEGIVLKELPKGQQAILTFKVNINPAPTDIACATTQFKNIASADPEGNGQGLDKKEADASIRAECQQSCPARNNTKDLSCLELTKTARNMTKKIENANGTTAGAGDVIEYTLSTTNIGAETYKGYVVEERMGDVLEYADIIDASGATLVKTPVEMLSWAPVDIKPGETIKKTILVGIKSPLPSTPASTSDPLSYDMKMVNVYGDTVQISLPSTPIKTVEQAVKVLPSTGAGTSIIISTLFVATAVYFYYRSRLMIKELSLVKQQFNYGGGI